MRRCLCESRSVVQDDEAFDAQPLHENRAQTGHGGISLGVTGNQSAEGHAAVKIHEAEDGVHDFAADVLEINVNTLWNGRGEFCFPVGLFVVDGRIKAEVFRDPIAFFVAAGDAHDAAAVNLSDLSDDATGCACGRGNDERFTFLRLRDFHAEKRRQSVDSQHAKKNGIGNKRNFRNSLE